jgi:cytochrome c-type biogenesis protein CcmH/NrfG
MRPNEEAVVAYRQSLRYRPNYFQTLFCLGYALKDGKRYAEAKAAWEHAARLAPHEPGPKYELARLADMVAGVRG